MVETTPGQVLIENINLGQDPNDSRFQLLRNVDSGLEVRCRRDFLDTSFAVNFNGNLNPIPIFFGLSEQNPNLFYPVVSSFFRDYAFLLEPGNVEYIFPGGVCVDMVWEERIGGNMCLRKSETFYDGDMQKIRGDRYKMKNKYEMMMHHPSNIPQSTIETPCAVLVYKLGRHHDNGGRPQDYRHIDAVLLGFCSDQGIYQDNLRLLADLKSGKIEGDFWWNHVDKLSDSGSFFGKLTFQVYSDKRVVAQDKVTHNDVPTIPPQVRQYIRHIHRFINEHSVKQTEEARRRLSPRRN